MLHKDGLDNPAQVADHRVAKRSLETPGQRIRFLRESKGWSQEALATRVHATQPAISQWETDKWLPSRASQFLLAEALDTTRYFLFGEKVA